VCEKLLKENALIGNNFQNSIKTLKICLNCGYRQKNEEDQSVIVLSNETEEYAKQLSVTLKVIYIYDGDQYRKYEVRLNAGEYSYHEVINKIREKV